jgi:hypothetical protein
LCNAVDGVVVETGTWFAHFHGACMTTATVNSFDVIWGVSFEFADYFYLRAVLEKQEYLKRQIKCSNVYFGSNTII